MKRKIFILTLLITLIISNVCFAADTDFAWNTVLERFAGTVDENGNLNTEGAVFTDIIPRIVGIIMIVSAGYIFMMGEMNGTATTIMRIILATGLITNLGLYLIVISLMFLNIVLLLLLLPCLMLKTLIL